MQKLNILIVGAGVAGLTFARLLSKQGLEPHIIEREPEEDFNKSGYMLGLLPLGGRVLNTLNYRNNYFDSSIQMENYEIHRADGELMKRYPLDFINERYGSYRGIARADLIDILLNQPNKLNIKFGTSVSNIKHQAGRNEVILSDGQAATYDLVVIADGIHSETRKLVLNKNEYEYYSTGWGGWVIWLQQDTDSSYKEYWGSNSFLGLYPVKNKIGIFLGGSVDKIKDKGLSKFKARVQNTISSDHDLPHQALDAFDEDKEPFFWEFHDCRSDIWHKNKVVLLGDAATGFLPTAGVGASMAMDSAAALADEISRVDKAHIDYGLNLYVQRQKRRVEKAQKDSRNLGKMMFIKSSLLSAIRNKILPFYSLKRMLSDLANVMDGK